MSAEEQMLRVTLTWTYTLKVPASYVEDEQMVDIATEAFMQGDGELTWTVQP